MTPSRNSLSFHGQGSTLFGRYLVNVLLSLVTLGIYSFWGRVKILQYQYEQTQLNGSPFRFLGTGKQFLFGFLKFLGFLVVFYIIVFASAMSVMLFSGAGIPGLVLWFILYMAVVLVITALLVVLAANSQLRYRLRHSQWRGLTGTYRGLNKELLPLYLKGLFLTVITLGIYGPWLSVAVRRYLYSKLSFGNVTARFDGKGGELLLLGLKGMILTLLTLGIYSFWYGRDLYRWTARNTVLIQKGADHPLSTEVEAGDLFRLWVPNLLLLVVTLGLAFPWVVVRNMNFFCTQVVLPDGLDLDNLDQGAVTEGSALGEALGDFLDMGDFGFL